MGLNIKWKNYERNKRNYFCYFFSVMPSINDGYNCSFRLVVKPAFFMLSGLYFCIDHI